MNATKLHVHSNTYLQIKQRCKCFLLCDKGANKNHKRRESSDESPIDRRSVRLSYRGYKAARITKAGIIYKMVSSLNAVYSENSDRALHLIYKNCSASQPYTWQSILVITFLTV